MNEKREGMSRELALRLEFGIIGLGIVALVMIFQPFSLAVFSLGCGLVVLAALANNLLPLAQPGKPLLGVVRAALIVALILCSAILLAIVTAHLYGIFFLTPVATATLVPDSPPFWEQPLVWSVATVAIILVILIRATVRNR